METALSYFADLLSSPHKDALLALARCASESAEAEKLRRLASAEGKAECTEYITKQHRSLLEVRAALGDGGVVGTRGRKSRLSWSMTLYKLVI